MNIERALTVILAEIVAAVVGFEQSQSLLRSAGSLWGFMANDPFVSRAEKEAAQRCLDRLNRLPSARGR